MYSRGRSKDVSPVALARQASEERRRNRTSIMAHYPLPTDPEKCSFFVPAPSSSPSPAATPFALTPPDPIPLPSHRRTRIIHIDDSYAPIDPHKSSSAAQVINPEPLPHSVQPHLSFSLPSDPLGGKPAFQVQGAQRARDRARAKCRYETLARAEQVFATILARSRRERLTVHVLRTHQGDELKERERATREHERPEREREHRRSANCVSHAHRSGFHVLAHATHPTPPSQATTDRFTYAFPIPSTSSFANPAPARPQQGGIKSRLGQTTLTNSKATNTRVVSFDDIRASMGGVLFPTAPGDTATSKTRRESELLGTLLEAVRWEEGERWQQRGGVKAPLLPEIASECGACASASLPLNGLTFPPSQALSLPSDGLASTSVSTASRPVSWLSFGSRKSTPSINTAQTTPLSAIKELPPFTVRPTPQRSCGCGRGQSLVVVDVNDTPLGSTVELSPTPIPSVASVNTRHGPSPRRSRKASLSMRTWFASLLSAASRVQQAYVTATMATLASSDYHPDGQIPDVSSTEAPSEYSTRPSWGWRAQHSDVAKFTSGTPSANQVTVPYLVFRLVDLERIPRSHPTAGSTTNGQTHDSAYHSADRHIFNTNRVHLLSRAQINSWRFRGAPGATPMRVSYRPELFYRLEPGGGSSRVVRRGGSALKWGWHVVWDTEGSVVG
ncbi:hypothetical protein EDB92DRAFT_1839786 [Lactarius akahatsu]|uniref:Uncharacterized protein n=1 Tax=Lactarius akahatsu TaxID=416441 RepID=A0AAD4LR30_9AGAM|nr:hypothetical protein EDB92DRAFT_1839786 [Lactarius akahatsu]